MEHEFRVFCICEACKLKMIQKVEIIMPFDEDSTFEETLRMEGKDVYLIWVGFSCIDIVPQKKIVVHLNSYPGIKRNSAFRLDYSGFSSSDGRIMVMSVITYLTTFSGYVCERELSEVINEKIDYWRRETGKVGNVLCASSDSAEIRDVV